MPTQPDARRRLADHMERRRLELGLRWQDVAEQGGVSLRAINSARHGTALIRPLTQAGIAKGLRWTQDSIQRILGGHEPVPLDAPHEAELPAGRPRLAMVPPPAEDLAEARAEGIYALLRPEIEALRAHVDSFPHGTPAAEIFPGDPEAQDAWRWDAVPAIERLATIALRRVERRRNRRSGLPGDRG